jgi:nicotinamidase-related amidase
LAHSHRAHPESCALLLIDVQEKLFPKIHDHEKLAKRLQILIEACIQLDIPIFITQQNPSGLGPTISTICALTDQKQFEKMHFSCLQDPIIKEELLKQKASTWILAGIETHICLLQTAYDLLVANKNVIVPRDTTSSRSALDYSSALEELKTQGARVTSTETLLFELLQTAKHEKFKIISQLIK